MKRSITRWTTTLATAAVLGLPAVGLAQAPAQPPTTEPQPPPRQPAQPTPQPPAEPTPQPSPEPPTATPPADPMTQPPAPSAAQTDQVTPEEHLKQAKSALDAIPPGVVTGRARTQIAELKRRISTLERSETAAVKPGATPKAGAPSWSTEVAAIDKTLTDLLGTESMNGTGAATGTAGATGTSGTAASPKAPKLDEATRTRLMDVRTNITAFAAGKSGTTSTPRQTPNASAAAAEPSPASAAPTSPAGAATSAAGTAPAGRATPGMSTTPSMSSPAAAASTPAAQAGAQGTPPASAGAPGEPAAAAAQAQPGAQGPVDPEAARRALTAARESLSQLTQLPAAAQLTGEPRTQVAQLISNFNELITAQSQWRASYDKVAGNVTALLGPDNTDAAPAGAAPSTAPGAAPGAAPTTGAPTTAAPTSGAVGTSGTTDLDPAIRAKLVELRRNLAEFEKASGGSAK